MKLKLIPLIMLFLSGIVISAFGQDNEQVQQFAQSQRNSTEVKKNGNDLEKEIISISADSSGISLQDDPWITFCEKTTSTQEEYDCCVRGLPDGLCSEDSLQTPDTLTLNPALPLGDISSFTKKITGNPPVFLHESVLKAPSTDTAKFAAIINAQLVNRVVGYAFVIAKNGQLAEQGQGGFAQVPAVDGGIPFTVNTDMNVFSVSKTITAIAVLQLMEKLGIEPDDPIAAWLPPSWQKGLGFDADGITFYDLLTHQTGVKQTISRLAEEDAAFAALSTNTYDGVKAIVEHGIYPEFADIGPVGYSISSYKNANYKLAAILVWQMAIATGDITSNSELAADIDSAAGYQAYVRKNVLQPAGVDGFCYSTLPESQRALAYDIDKNFVPFQFTQGGSMGGNFPDSLLTAGPKNWWLSAMDLGAIAAHLHYGNLLSPESRKIMDDLEMGSELQT